MSVQTARREVINNRYLLLEVIGHGGMGTVYRAKDRLTNQIIALKRVNPVEMGGSMIDTTELRWGLAAEFKTLASLRHPNIISVLDYGFDEQRQPFFSMELLENSRSILEAGIDQPFNVQVDLIIAVLRALEYLHRRGVVHRDVKPANVQVVGNRVKVLDFGLAAVRGYIGEPDELVGTLAYLAPELLLGESASEASDLYSVGVIAYELFAGRHPFLAGGANQFVQDMLYTEPDVERIPGLPDAAQALLRRLLAKRPADRLQQAQDAVRAFAELTGSTPVVETPDSRDSFIQAAQFVGREVELQALSDALRDAHMGHGSAWLVGGESGVGKSRLLEELRTFALVSGTLVLRGQAIREGGDPYRVWRSALRRLCLQVELSDYEAGALKWVVPDIEQLIGRAVPAVTETELSAERQLMRVIEQLFQRVDQPLLVILEDIHWVGEESLYILRRLSRNAAKLPLLLIASYRDDETPHLPNRLTSMKAMMLNRLNHDAIAELTRSILGDKHRQEVFVDYLERETEGNVFFIVEVVRALAEDAGELDEVTQLTLPPSVFAGGIQKIIRRRLDKVPVADRILLKVAAVAGRQLDLNLLRGMEPELEQWLSVCADAAVLEVQEGQWRFTHDKLREGLLAELTPDEQVTLHGWVAKAIERVYPNVPEQYAALAHHWGKAGDLTRQLHYATLAGDNAMRLYAYEDAARHYSPAIEVARQIRVPGDKLAYLYTAKGRALELQGRFHQAYMLYNDLQKYADQHNDQSLRLTALVNEAVLCSAPNVEYDAACARAAADEALILARKLRNPQAEAQSLWVLMRVLSFTYDIQQAEAFGREALNIARQHSLREQEGYILNDLSRLLVMTNWHQEGLVLLQQAHAIWHELNNLPMVAETLAAFVTLHTLHGDLNAAAADANEAYSISQSIDNRWGQAVSLAAVGMVYLLRGEFTHAIRAMETCISTSEAVGYVVPLLTTRSQLALTYALLGDYRQALDLVQQAQAAAAYGGLYAFMKREPAAVRAWVYWQQGNHTAARAIVDRYNEDDPAFTIGAATEIFAELQVKLLLAEGRAEDALSYTDGFLMQVEQAAVPILLPKARYLKARVLQATGQADEARALLECAHSEAEKLNARLHLFQILVALGATREAREMIEKILVDIKSPELRERFLQQPELSGMLL